MRIGVPKETAAGERRVALVPEVVRKLKGKDHEVVVESGAAAGALLPDEQFTEAGATIGDPWDADVVVKVAPPSAWTRSPARPTSAATGPCSWPARCCSASIRCS